MVEELCQHGTDGNVNIDEGVIWDVTQRFQSVEKSSQTAADRLSMEYYKNKVGQCIELCKEQLLDDNLKFSSQLQAEDAFNQHLVRCVGSKGHINHIMLKPRERCIPPTLQHSKKERGRYALGWGHSSPFGHCKGTYFNVRPLLTTKVSYPNFKVKGRGHGVTLE